MWKGITTHLYENTITPSFNSHPHNSHNPITPRKKKSRFHETSSRLNYPTPPTPNSSLSKEGRYPSNQQATEKSVPHTPSLLFPQSPQKTMVLSHIPYTFLPHVPSMYLLPPLPNKGGIIYICTNLCLHSLGARCTSTTNSPLSPSAPESTRRSSSSRAINRWFLGRSSRHITT